MAELSDARIHPDILCVVLHYGVVIETHECLKSLADQNRVDIVVCDNDPSQTFPASRHPSNVRVCRTGGGMGFAAANNRAVAFGRQPWHEYVLLLNNDTIVEQFAVDHLLATMKDRQVGAVGPRMPYASHPSRIWACGGSIDPVRMSLRGLKTIRDDSSYAVDYLPGAAVLCRLSVWDRLGGLPEAYFLAFEEADFSVRVRRAGYTVVVEPSAVIYHHVGMSSLRTPGYEYNKFRSRMKFGRTLWRSSAGAFAAGIASFLQVIKAREGLGLWLRAVRDEVSGVPLNAARIRLINAEFQR